MSEVAEHETDSEDVGAPVPPDAPPDDEPDADDDDGQQEPGEPAGEPSEAVDQKLIDKFFEQLEKEASRHAKRLGEIMGEEAQRLNLCPTCAPIEGMPNLVGFVLDAPLHDEAIARMRTALGLNEGVELQPDPYSTLCGTCEGWGVVATGSHVRDMDAITCRDCKGSGFIVIETYSQDSPLATANGADGVQPAGVPAAIGPEPPEAEALRRRGYAVIPPIQAS